MAGGLGKRMNSDIPKVLHQIGNKPMLVRVIETSISINPKKILIVVGKYKELIKNTISDYVSLDNIEFVDQKNPMGTGHAIQCCIDNLKNFKNYRVLILSGDVPLVSNETIQNVVKNMDLCKIITTYTDDPKGLGRIITNNSKLVKIIEDKDCTDDERKIELVNTGIYAFKSEMLCKYLPMLNNNNNKQNEYYLTDVIELISVNEHTDIDMYIIDKNKQYEIIGVNTKEQLDNLNNIYIKLMNP